MTADLTPIHSENIASVGYDAETQTLILQFKNQRVYAYDQVPALTHSLLLSAHSPGKYFYRFIRGVYSAREIMLPSGTPTGAPDA